MKRKKGLFITLEGIEGSGKSTLSNSLKERLEKLGHEVILTREPGGNQVAEDIRDVILENEMEDETELLLFVAARSEHLKSVVIPALEDGKIVIMDRFIHSTYAYQGYGRNIDLDQIKLINNFATKGLTPDVTFFIDISLEESRRRKKKSGDINRLDEETDKFFNRVILGYEDMVKSGDITRIDGERDLDIIEEELLDMLIEKLV